MKYFLAILILIFTATTIAQAQVTDSTKQKQTTVQADSAIAANSTATDSVDDGGFLLFLLLYAMGVCAIIVVGIGVGILITIGALFIISAMITAGIFSASVIVGIYTRSLTKGFKVFFVSCSIVAGSVFGAIALWALNRYTHWHDTKNAILLGGAFGLVAGLAGGMISFYFLQRLVARLRSKISMPIMSK